MTSRPAPTVSTTLGSVFAISRARGTSFAMVWDGGLSASGRVSNWPGVVVEFGPERSGAGPKIHFIVCEPSGVRIEFAFDPRFEEARKAR